MREGTVRPDRSQVAFFERPKALAAARRSSSPVPLLVLIVNQPWLMVIGSDSPAFALYSDGRVIFRQGDGFRSAVLSPAETARLTDAFSNPRLAALAGRYRASSATDQPDNDLLIYGRGKPSYMSVYGSLKEEDVRSRLPPAVVGAFDRLRHFSAHGARPWLPAKIEVMLSPYDYAPEASVVWPTHWPALADPATRRRGDLYSLYLPSSELPALRSFLHTRREKGAVEVGGKKWSASFRIPFPQEQLWMAPNDEVAATADPAL